jgi:hypothetical protein
MKLKLLILVSTVLAATACFYIYKDKNKTPPPVQNVVTNNLYVYLLALKDTSVRYDDTLFNDWITGKLKELSINATKINYYTPAKQDYRYRAFKQYCQLLSPQEYTQIRGYTLDYFIKHKPRLTIDLLQQNFEVNARLILTKNDLSLTKNEVNYLTYIYPAFDPNLLLKEGELYIKRTKQLLVL